VTITFRNINPGLINLLFGGVVLGEAGYRAYGDAVGWKDYLGRPMPQWEDLTEPIRAAWDRAAYAIIAETMRFYDHEAAETMRLYDHDTAPVGCECGHLSVMHDVADADGSDKRCCVDGCRCGAGG
jgi:hypothetical protein